MCKSESHTKGSFHNPRKYTFLVFEPPLIINLIVIIYLFISLQLSLQALN